MTEELEYKKALFDSINEWVNTLDEGQRNNTLALACLYLVCHMNENRSIGLPVQFFEFMQNSAQYTYSLGAVTHGEDQVLLGISVLERKDDNNGTDEGTTENSG